MKFKTNIKCAGCLTKVSPALNQILGEDNWEVDVQDPKKILSVVGEVSSVEIIRAVSDAGFTVEQLS